MKKMMSVAVLLATSALAHHDATGGVEQLAWLAGSWCGASETATAEEHWLAPHGGVLLGVHRDVRQGRPAFFEFLRIAEEDGEIFYHASPDGREATAFRLVEIAGRRAVFANPEHDYPQRIIYESSGDELTATIEGEVDGETRSSAWRWQKDACGFLAAESADGD